MPQQAPHTKRRSRRSAPEQSWLSVAGPAQRALGGALMGAAVWALCHTPALLAWLVNPRGFTADGRQIALVFALNLALCAGIGALVGVLRPVGRHTFGAALKGALCGALALGSFAFASFGDGALRPTVVAALCFGAPIGAVFGVGAWRRALRAAA